MKFIIIFELNLWSIAVTNTIIHWSLTLIILNLFLINTVTPSDLFTIASELKDL